MWAARRQQIKMAALLLQAGADINCVDHSGSSALHHACSLQHNDMVRFLIANKADVSLVDADGLSPIQLAREETLLVFMQAILTLKQQSDGTVGAKAEAPPGSPGKRRSSVLTPTKASMARSPSKEGPSPGPDDPDKTEVAKDRLDQMSQFLRNQEHIPLNVYDGCDARSGDLYLCVEHCYDCACHGMSLRHDQQKYLQLSNCILFELVQTVLKMKRNFHFVKRVFAFRVKPTAPNRLGALEVTAAFKTRVRRRPTNKLDLIRSISSTPLKETWLSQRLHSKLSNLKSSLLHDTSSDFYNLHPPSCFSAGHGQSSAEKPWAYSCGGCTVWASTVMRGWRIRPRRSI